MCDRLYTTVTGVKVAIQCENWIRASNVENFDGKSYNLKYYMQPVPKKGSKSFSFYLESNIQKIMSIFQF